MRSGDLTERASTEIEQNPIPGGRLKVIWQSVGLTLSPMIAAGASGGDRT